jgi:hypothetical protein
VGVGVEGGYENEPDEAEGEWKLRCHCSVCDTVVVFVVKPEVAHGCGVKSLIDEGFVRQHLCPLSCRLPVHCFQVVPLSPPALQHSSKPHVQRPTFILRRHSNDRHVKPRAKTAIAAVCMGTGMGGPTCGRCTTVDASASSVSAALLA